MSNHRTVSLLLAAAALGLTTSLHAQGRSAVTTAELEAAVAVRPAGTRQAVRDFLALPQVQKVADRMGVSTTARKVPEAAWLPRIPNPELPIPDSRRGGRTP